MMGVTIRVRKNGPYVVDGDDVRIVDWEGREYPGRASPGCALSLRRVYQQAVLRRDAFQDRVCRSGSCRGGVRGGPASVLMRSFFAAQISIGVAAVGALVAAVVLFGLYRWRLRLLQDLQADLIRQVHERSEQLEDANRKLASMSYLDAVTDVANRRSFEEQLKMEWRRSMRAKSSLSLLMADIDGFKAYNDALGHHAGDDSLRTVAAVIYEKARRAGDVVARYGGEEFAVLLPDTENAGAAILAERIRAAVEERNIWHPSTERGRLTISVGVATTVGSEDRDGSALVKAADAALYQAKRDGRNLVRVAESSPATP